MNTIQWAKSGKKMKAVCTPSLLFLLFSFFFFILPSFAPIRASDSSPTQTPSPTPVQYNLPYPGLLPDNPLYFLKVIRDQFVDFLISNPHQKAEYDLLQSDKHTQAAYLLVTQEHKMSLAATTLSKGDNYFEDALAKLVQAQKQGMGFRNVASQMAIANRKHEEVALDLLPSFHGTAKQSWQYERMRMQQFQIRVDKFIAP